MKINAYAKINLGLDVTGKRDDGYHEVRMIMQNIDLHDELDIGRTDGSGITITTDREDLSVGEDNLIHKAARLTEIYILGVLANLSYINSGYLTFIKES